MAGLGLRNSGGSRKRKVTVVLILSYAWDWIVLVVFGVVSDILGNITPNKRPFSLENPDISFPFTTKETVNGTTLLLCNTIAPIIAIAIICLVFVPGSTVPRGTPKSLIWKRKLWELHVGWLGLALSLIAAWFVTNGLKNLYGKPRPELLARCQPDIANVAKYVVGGIANVSSNGQLVSAAICKNPDLATLDDGFRSCPSGHSSSSAAGLVYLSLFIASKFAITLPYLSPWSLTNPSASTAFPSRLRLDDGPESYELASRARQTEHLAAPADPSLQKSLARHQATVASVRQQAAAPPIYLLVVAVVPFFAAVFIASSRWFDFRHHGFDIIFGFLIGTVTATFSFRYYHLPVARGAGWAWGPRSPDKAFWAGVGSFSYAADRVTGSYRRGDEEEAFEAPDPSLGHASGFQNQASAQGRRPQEDPEEEPRGTAYADGAQG